MKKLSLIFTALLLGSLILKSQTPFSFINTGSSKTTKKTKRVSANNFWLGSQIGYKFGGTDEFADNLLISGRLLYDIDLGTTKFKLPVMGNISTLRDSYSHDKDLDKDTMAARAQELMLSSQGINVGLYPFYLAVDKDKFKFVVHGSAVWKLNMFKTEEETNEYLDQGRFSLGVEASLGSTKGDQAPLVVSVTPVFTIFDKEKYQLIFGEERSTITSLEITGVLPVGKGVGVLFETIVAEKPYNAFRVGLIFSAATNNE